MRRNTRAAAARRGAGRLIRGCSQNPLLKLRNVLASPAQLGRCRRHTTTEGSEAQNPLRKLRKSKPLQTRTKRERHTGQNDQRDDKADSCLCCEPATPYPSCALC